MMKYASKIVLLALLVGMPVDVSAQNLTPSVPAAYSLQQIDQMTAPIALYPDQLVAQILMAATIVPYWGWLTH